MALQAAIVEGRALAMELKSPEFKNNEYHLYSTEIPVDNKVNNQIIEIVSEYFDTAKSLVKIIKGNNSKIKVIEIDD